MGGTQGGPGAAAEPEGQQAPPARGLGPPRRAQDVLPQLRAALLDAQPEVVVVPRTVRCCTLCASRHTTHTPMAGCCDHHSIIRHAGRWERKDTKQHSDKTHTKSRAPTSA